MSEWQVRHVAARPESKRAFIWEAICPTPPPELTWDNGFGRGMRCGCRRFRTEGKARRYVERMTA